MEIRKKDLIQYYQKKRLFLFLDEWGFYTLMCFMYMFGVSVFFVVPVFVYGSIALYTSYKNIDKIESIIVPVEQDIYAYKDVYSLIKYCTELYDEKKVLLCKEYTTKRRKETADEGAQQEEKPQSEDHVEHEKTRQEDRTGQENDNSKFSDL